MIIDFHTHAFPDEIAKKAIPSLAATSGNTPYGDGTHGALKAHLEDAGIDRAVVLNIAVKPHQAAHINASAARFDAVLSGEDKNARFIQFGSLHPLSPTLREDAGALKKSGLRGVKIHPDYQKLDLDDERWFELFALCSEMKLPVVTHAGFDPVSPDHMHATPKMIQSVVTRFPTLILVAAHMGGTFCYDEAAALLAGNYENLYFDTAFTRERASRDQLLRLIDRGGSDRILFGSDYPWDGAGLEKEWIEQLPISVDARERILGENAAKLLAL